MGERGKRRQSWWRVAGMDRGIRWLGGAVLGHRESIGRPWQKARPHGQRLQEVYHCAVHGAMPPLKIAHSGIRQQRWHACGAAVVGANVAQQCGSADINLPAALLPSVHPQVYDSGDGMFAARLWWALTLHGHPDVRILEGGWGRWQGEGRKVALYEPCTLKVCMGCG